MNIYVTYGVIFVALLLLELLYFRIADHFNIIDKPNERSSHSTIVLRGGGVIFTISILLWMALQIIAESREPRAESLFNMAEYVPFVIGLVLITGVSFIDDIRSLPDSVRLVAQFVAMGLVIYQVISDSSAFSVDSLESVRSVLFMVLVVILALIVFVGATNIINFMDGINGITGAYAIAVLVPLLMKNEELRMKNLSTFVEESFLWVVLLAVVVFCIFNFRPKGKAKCFAGDVGSIGIAFILLFAIGKLIMTTGDVTYLIFLIVYGVDGCMTIAHRIMLHENLGEAHRKHAFQLMANELRMSHVTVSLFYMMLQLAISLGFLFAIPNTVAAHWGYLVGVLISLAIIYVLFMKKFYHLHEEYLESLETHTDLTEGKMKG